MKNSNALYALGITSVLCLFSLACDPGSDKTPREAATEIDTIAPAVTVTVKDSVATLTGEVADDATRMKLENTAKDIKGVTSVQNGTIVTAPVPVPTPDAAPTDTNNDVQIRTAIAKGLDNKNIKGITVTVQSGEVVLTGSTPKENITTILKIASESNPRKVTNKLTVR